MRLAFISGPYRATNGKTVLENVRAAEAVAIEYWRKGYAVICPHKNTAFFDGLAPDNVWLDGDLLMLSKCDLIVMIKGWEHSEGAKSEHVFAKTNGLEIIYL